MAVKEPKTQKNKWTLPYKIENLETSFDHLVFMTQIFNFFLILSL